VLVPPQRHPLRLHGLSAGSNKERVARLEAEGRMTGAGRAAVDAAKADGSWSILDAVEALVVPADLAAALDERVGGGRAGTPWFRPPGAPIFSGSPRPSARTPAPGVSRRRPAAPPGAYATRTAESGEASTGRFLVSGSTGGPDALREVVTGRIGKWSPAVER
jgi:hypothetical protein